MKIAFVTTQNPTQSTLIGRIFPIATRLAQNNHTKIHILGHNGNTSNIPSNITWHTVGHNPFTLTEDGKKHLSTFKLITTILRNTITSLITLNTLKPDSIIIVKPLPQNVAATSLYVRWCNLISTPRPRIVLDIDDYELTANQLTSLLQRAAVHWSQQQGHHLANHVITATPFLQEYSRQLAGNLPQTMLPTTADMPDTKPASNPSTPTLLYIGSLSISSGHKVNLLPKIWEKVLKNHPSAHLRIAGDGHDLAHLKQQFHDAQNVKFTGRFSTKDLPDLLENVVTIIDPIDASLTNRAKSSYRATLSALLGIPLISSNVGIRPLWFPKEFHSRFFAKPNDATSYAQKINDILKTPLTDEEHQALQAHAQQFTWSSLLPIYQKTLTK